MFEVEPPAAVASAEPPKSESAWLKERKKAWARLIRRVHDADHLLCRCGHRMHVVGFITYAPVICKTSITSGGVSTHWNSLDGHPRCWMNSAPTRSRPTDRSKATGGRNSSIYPFRLNTRSVHGSLVASHHAVNILMEKDRQNLRRAV